MRSRIRLAHVLFRKCARKLKRPRLVVINPRIDRKAARKDARPRPAGIGTCRGLRSDDDDSILLHGREGSLDLQANDVSDDRCRRHKPELREHSLGSLMKRDAVVLELDPDQVARVRQATREETIVVSGYLRNRRLHIMIGKAAIRRGVGGAAISCAQDDELFAANRDIARKAIAPTLGSESPV